jgi:hypothetical protein
MKVKYDLINLETAQPHGDFETLDEARGAAQYDRLTAYAIWHGFTCVVVCEPDIDDDDQRGVPAIMPEPLRKVRGVQ